ncbi:MAG: hypothetical protein Q8876_00880 [Bacillota bacterium]|nr:hypothetical protein [Bacillota bacterium]
MKKKKIIVLIGTVVAINIFASILTFKHVTNADSLNNFQETKIHLCDTYFDPFTGDESPNTNKLKILPQYSSEVSTGYSNNDGTVTLDVYSNPIRFINSNNQLQDIDTRITNVDDQSMRDAGYVYTIASDDIQSFYPKSLQTGILIKKNDFNYTFGINQSNEILAQYVNKENIVNNKINMIEYKNAFSQNSKFDLYPSNLGTNSEIILDKKPNSNEMNFWLNADNCNVSLEEGGYISMKTDQVVQAGLGYTTNQVIGIIQAPLLKDANGKVSFHSRFYLNQISDGKYTITMDLDKAFLNDKATKYPVKAFSAFELYRDKQPDSAIYSSQQFLNSYLSNYSIIGNSDTYGKGENRIRFNFAKGINLQSSQIIKATYSVYNFSNKNPKDNLELCTMQDDWCSLISHWNDGIKYGNCTSSLKMDSGPILPFDITQEVKKWCDAPDGLAEHKGVLLRSKDEQEGIWNVIMSNDNSLYNNRTELILK